MATSRPPTHDTDSPLVVSYRHYISTARNPATDHYSQPSIFLSNNEPAPQDTYSEVSARLTIHAEDIEWDSSPLPWPSIRPHGYTVGSSRQNDIVLPATTRISRIHLRIFLNEHLTWLVSDLSSNGSSVNNEGVASETCKLRLGARGDRHLDCWDTTALHPERPNMIRVDDIEFMLYINVQQTRYDLTPHTKTLEAFVPQPHLSSAKSVTATGSSLGALNANLLSRTSGMWSNFLILDSTRTFKVRPNKFYKVRIVIHKTEGWRGLARVFDADTPAEVIVQKRESFFALLDHLNQKIASNRVTAFLDLDSGGGRARVLMITQYCPGYIPLDSQSLLSQEQVENVTLCAMEGLAYLHKCRLLHRDIKPQVILVNLDGDAKLSGFSECIAADTSDVICGEAEYQAPEVAEGPYGPKADVFSLCRAIEYASTEALPGYQLHTGLHELLKRGQDEDPKTRPSSFQMVKAMTNNLKPDNDAPDRGARAFKPQYFEHVFHFHGHFTDGTFQILLRDIADCIRMRARVSPNKKLRQLPNELYILIDDKEHVTLRSAQLLLNAYDIRDITLREPGHRRPDTSLSGEMAEGGAFDLSAVWKVHIPYHVPSKTQSITHFFSLVSKAVYDRCAAELKPNVAYDIKAAGNYSGIYIDPETFNRACAIAKESGSISIPEWQSRGPEAWIDSKATIEDSIIIQTDRIFPGSFVINRHDTSTVSYKALHGLRHPSFKDIADKQVIRKEAQTACHRDGLPEISRILDLEKTDTHGNWTSLAPLGLDPKKLDFQSKTMKEIPIPPATEVAAPDEEDSGFTFTDRMEEALQRLNDGVAGEGDESRVCDWMEEQANVHAARLRKCKRK